MAKNTKFGNYTPPSYSRMTMEDEPTKKRRVKNLRNNPVRLGDAADEAAVVKKLAVIRDSAGELTRAQMLTPNIDEEANAASSKSIRPLTAKYPEGSNKGKGEGKGEGKDESSGSSKKKKDPIVSKAELDKSGFTNLRDFMNAKKYDEATGKFVNRANAKTRRDGKPANAVPPEHYSEDYKKGGSVKSKSKSASRRGDGIAQRGKTRA